MRYLLIVVPFVLLACSSSSTTEDAGQDAGPADAGPSDGGTDAGPTDGGSFTLNINNYLSWCTITENGSAFSAMKSFPAGSMVALNATPESSSFVWGYWLDIDAGTKSTTMSITADMTRDTYLLACCPFPPPQSQTCP